MSEKVVDIGFYVFPAIGTNYAYLDADSENMAKRHAKDAKPFKLRVSVFSPRKLRPSELSKLEDGLCWDWYGYIGALQLNMKRTGMWLKLGGMVEGGLVAGIALGRYLSLANWAPWHMILFELIGEIIFWAGLFFGPVVIAPGLGSIWYWRRCKRIERFFRDWQALEFIEGVNDKGKEMVGELQKFYLGMSDDTEENIYSELKGFSRRRGYIQAEEFYELMYKRATRRESPLVKLFPIRLRKKIVASFRQLRIEVPKTLIPVGGKS